MPHAMKNDCAIDATMSVIEGRWKAVVLCKLMTKGTMRFSHLMKEIEGVSPRMLTKQLKELERDGMVLRKTYTEIPPRVEYSLTGRGKSIIPVLTAIAQWGVSNVLREIVEIHDE
ncbi:MAG: helix-turn-helix transcriptional regulator [Methanomassiliicoccaceae archaeon]|nr:helix-turn-helix transcriptional regulator [Methanomassiliicoccaceae archaeon]